MSADTIGAGDQWMSDDEYQFVKDHVPVLCVDIFLSPAGEPGKVGLIWRDAGNGTEGWCCVGGRVLRGERLADAVDRHVATTLGPTVKVDPSTLRFVTVIEYCDPPGGFHDPWKHSVGMTYTAACSGEPEPAGEALSFRWFDIASLPPASEFGFGQDKVLTMALKGGKA